MINTGHIMDDGWSSRRWRRDRQEPGRIDLGLPGPLYDRLYARRRRRYHAVQAGGALMRAR